MANRTHQVPRTTSPSELIERRHSARGTLHGEPSRNHLVTLIVGSYREMPGLALDLQQAARLFGLRDFTCRIVLEDLVRAGRLRRRPDGRYALL